MKSASLQAEIKADITDCLSNLLAMAEHTGNAYLSFEDEAIQEYQVRIYQAMSTLAKHWTGKWRLLHDLFGDPRSFKGMFSLCFPRAVQNVIEVSDYLAQGGLSKSGVLILTVGCGLEMLAFKLAGYTDVVATIYPKNQRRESASYRSFYVQYDKVGDLIREDILRLRENVIPYKIEPPHFNIFHEKRRFQVVIATSLPVMYFVEGVSDGLAVFKNCVSHADLIMFKELAIQTKDRDREWFDSAIKYLKLGPSLKIQTTEPKPCFLDSAEVLRTDLTIIKRCAD